MESLILRVVSKMDQLEMKKYIYRLEKLCSSMEQAIHNDNEVINAMDVLREAEGRRAFHVMQLNNYNAELVEYQNEMVDKYENYEAGK